MERGTVQLLAKRGLSQREIARLLRLSRNTVARVLGEPVDRQPARRGRRSSVDPYRDRIEEWLRQGLTVVRMLELARGDPDRPYRGGRSTWGEGVRRIRLELKRHESDVPIRFEGLPGEYLQVDWGEIRTFRFTQRPWARRYFLCCRLKHSRWSWTMWASDMRQETLLRGLVECFLALGFVPWVLVFDNMKTVTTGRDSNDQPIWHPALARFAAEFGFHPEACAVARGNQKGSVENLVKWVKRSFLPGRSFADERDLADQNQRWLEEINGRKNDATGQPPSERLLPERRAGGALPLTAADYGLLETARVSAESLVHVRGNQYSVPIEYRHLTLTVRLHAERVVIFHNSDRVAEHSRRRDGARDRVVQARHFEPVLAKKPRARVMLYRQLLLDLGGPAELYVAEVSCRRRSRLSDEMLAIHALLERHGPAALLDAMQRMSALDAFGAEYLEAAVVSTQTPRLLRLLDEAPPQREVDRDLAQYEEFALVSMEGAR